MEFKKFLRSAVAELRPYITGEDLSGVMISEADKENGSPMPGDMIARNPANNNDQWLVSENYFKANFTGPVVQEKPSQYPVETDLSFGKAIEALESGYRVCRKGWNGKGMFLFLLTSGTVPVTAIHDPSLRRVVQKELDGDDSFEALPSIRMFTADKKILTGWLASQTDMMAKDWMILGDYPENS